MAAKEEQRNRSHAERQHRIDPMPERGVAISYPPAPFVNIGSSVEM
jgi:hypothetical protein